jgi:hypothetical protein
LSGGAEQPNSALNGTMHAEEALPQPNIHGQIGLKTATVQRKFKEATTQNQEIYENKGRWDLVTSTTHCSVTHGQGFDAIGQKTDPECIRNAKLIYEMKASCLE